MGSIDREGLITRLLKRGTLLTRTDVLAVMNGMEEVIADVHLEGYTVNLPLFNTSFSISGVFEGSMDSFDGNRHKLNINVSKGTLLRDAEKKVKFEKTNVPSPLPQIQEVRDSVSGAMNDRLTSKGVIEVRGYNLKIDGNDPACGLWFVSETGEETKAVVIIENKPSKILAMIPELATGNYQVKVVTQYANGVKLLKTPKLFIYPKNLAAING
jgi:hypothetical protein